MRTFLIALAGMIAVSAIAGVVLSRQASSFLDEWASGEGMPSWLSDSSPSSEPTSVLYQYVDESGGVQFVDTLEEVPEDQRATAGRIEVVDRAPLAGRRATPTARASVNAQDVVMYTAPG